MIPLDRYTITETLYESAAVALYRAVRACDALPVVIKALRAQPPSPRAIERLCREFEIARALDSPYVIKPYELETQPERLLLILEDFGGEPLSRMLGSPLELNRFFAIAIQLASALADIHRQGIVHKDLKPANILIQPHTGQIKLADFGTAAPLTHIPIAPSSVSLIEGSLAYMAPEQTGRMNRGIDHRSDLYALGVTFYELLTGALPFQAADPLEWMHCHIARTPLSPRQLVPALPEPIAAIVLKLLAKQAEQRYQSAHGLRCDLDRCRAQWESNERIDPFPLGERDVSELFVIPQRLYGREEQVAALLNTFAQVMDSGQPAFVLVSGYAGIGKSSLVQELHQPIVRAHGFFLAGKFDQYQRDIPYATIVPAFRDLIQQILTASDERIQDWQAALQQALGALGQLMVDMIPQLALIIGPQPPVMELPPTEAQQRFQRVFQRFVGVFATQAHPLALFLDDLQWLDLASLTLIASVMTHPETRYLLVLGAYRDYEVSPGRPLMRTLEAIRTRGVLTQEIVLRPLAPAHLQRLVADTVHRPAKAAAPLARLVYDKTAGNPFFAIQFLTTLYQERLLAYDDRHTRWSWDLPAIRRQGFTDNVVELMVGKLKRLSVATQAALTLAACVGNSVEVGTLALIGARPEAQIHADLQGAVGAGLLLRRDDAYQFLHDRVQEAAYALLPEEQRAAQHLRIGRLLLAHTPEDRLPESIFEIVSQLNRGLWLITDREERGRVATLNLRAGRKAKASTAYASACTFLASGAALLGEEGWKSGYELAITLCLERAECEYLRGSFAEAERRLALALFHARIRADKAAAYRLRIELYTINGEVERAVDTMLECAALFGLALERHPSAETVKEQYARVMQCLGDHSIEDLIGLPPMSDRDVRALIEALMAASPPVTNYDDCLHFAIVSETVRLSIQYGSAPCSVAAYAYFGTMIGSLLGNYRDGYRFGKLSYDLVERDGLVAYKARSCAMFAYGIAPWTHHISTALPYLEEGLRAGAAAGDPVFACYCCCCIVSVLLASGDSLDEVDRESARMLDFVRNARYDDVEDNLLIQRRLILRLRGLTSPRASTGGLPGDDERLDARILGRIPTVVCWYYVRKLQERFLFGDYQEALFASIKAKEVLWTSTHHWESCEYSYFLALTLSALYAEAPSHDQEEYLRTLRVEGNRYRVWAENCPENFLNRYALVSAEIARVEGRELDAEQLYEQAIRSAHENSFVQNEALAYELASKFYRTRGFATIAEMYLRAARSCYARWGADGKLRQLDQHYPQQVELRPLTPTVTFATRAEQLDLLAVIKASQAISREILLPNLQETLMRLVLESAGAQRGCLLLADGESLTIHAQAVIAGAETRVSVTPALLVSAATLPMSLLNYIRRTGEAVVLADAAAEGIYAADAYIVRQQPRSVLGLPIVRQAQIVGMLYLENNLIAGAFTSNTLTALELLASQAAISLENALLYANLQQKNAERQRAEEALGQAEAKYRDIFENTVEGIFQSTPAGQIITANPALARMLGYESPTALIAAISDFQAQHHVRPERRAEFRRLLEEHGAVHGFEVELYRKDGSTVWISVNARAVRDNDGHMLYYEGTDEDITERKRAEQERELLFAQVEQERERAEARAAELDAFISSMIDGVVLYAPDGTIVRTNKAAERIFDLTRVPPALPLAQRMELFKPKGEDGQPITNVDDMPALRALRGEMVNNVVQGLYSAQTGQFIWLAINAAPVRDTDGRLLGAVLSFRDITERKRAEEALRESEKQTRLIVDSAYDAFIAINADDQITAWNHQAEVTFGWSPEEVVGRLLTETIIPAQHREVHRQGLARFLATGEGPLLNQRIEVTALHRDGHGFPVELTITPIRWGDSYIFSAFVHDITKRKWVEEELRKHHEHLEELVNERTAELAVAKDKAEVADRLKSAFLATMSHELRTPLNSIIGFTGILLQGMVGPLNDEQELQLGMVKISARHLLNLINEILDLSKIEAGQVELRLEPFDLRALIDKTVQTLAPLAEKKQLKLIADVAPEVGWVISDPHRVEQILINLLSNAIKFTAQGHVRIECQAIEGWLLTSVIDTGIGVKPEDMTKLFTSFRQLDSTLARQHEGTGLGLAICQKLAGLLGGEIRVESIWGVGSNFTFALPRG